MEYLNVGMSRITAEKMVSIQNPDEWMGKRSKPSGGLWFSDYDKKCPTFNEWVDFILEPEQANVFFYKYYKKFIHNALPCSLVVLREDASIFVLDSMDKFDYLMQKYPYNDTVFSYEDMTGEYDGIYIDARKLLRETSSVDYELRNKYNVKVLSLTNNEISKDDMLVIKKIELIDKLRHECVVNTLLLFDTDCIDHYYSGSIKVDNFELGYYNEEGAFYQIELQYDTPLKIESNEKTRKRIRK